MDSSNLQETLKAIDAVIIEKQIAIELGKDLEELKKDPRFQRVIMDGYINTESKKLFEILTNPTGESCYSIERVHLGLAAISHFKGYVGTDEYEGTVFTEAKHALGELQREQDFREQETASSNEIEGI